MVNWIKFSLFFNCFLPTLLVLIIADFDLFAQFDLWNLIPTGIYLLKINNKSTSTRLEICSKLKQERQQNDAGRCSGVFTVNFGHVSHLVLEFLLLTLSMELPTGIHLHVKQASLKGSTSACNSLFCKYYVSYKENKLM